MDLHSLHIYVTVVQPGLHVGLLTTGTEVASDCVACLRILFPNWAALSSLNRSRLHPVLLQLDVPRLDIHGRRKGWGQEVRGRGWEEWKEEKL